MKNLILIIFFMAFPLACFAQQASLDSKFNNKNTEDPVQHAKTNSSMLVLDDDITMDKLYTSIRYELVYSGMDKNNILFKHNEYLSDNDGYFNKLGYSDNLEFDMAKSRVIDYKGLKIEIVSAGPEELSYRILTEQDNSQIVRSY